MSAAPALRTDAPPPRAIAAANDLTAAERVAVVLTLLEPERARALAADWPGDAVDRVVAAYEGMGALPRPVVLEVVAGFVSEVLDPRPAVRGGERQAGALAAAIRRRDAAEEAEATVEDPLAEDASPDAVWAYAAGLEASDLARLVSGERVAVIAAVTARIGEAKGAGLLAALEEPVAAAVVVHMAGGHRLPGSTMDAIAEALRCEAAGGGTAPEAEDPATRLTALLNRCPHSRQLAVLSSLREREPEIAERVEGGLLRFASLAERLPRTAAPALFREVEQDVLDMALRYGAEAEPRATEFLYSNISQRLAEQIRERVAARPVPSAQEGEAAQAALIGTLLGWAEEGRFSLSD